MTILNNKKVWIIVMSLFLVYMSTLSNHDWLNASSVIYRISSVIRQSFFPFQNHPKDLDPSCKKDLDLWDGFGRVKLVL